MKNSVLILTIVLTSLISACTQATPSDTKHPNAPPNVNNQIICSQDAKQCPNGSYVERAGPKCEFAPCSATTATPAPSLEKDIFCMKDTVQCPDGSDVGRSLPRCDFTCPATPIK